MTDTLPRPSAEPVRCCRCGGVAPKAETEMVETSRTEHGVIYGWAHTEPCAGEMRDTGDPTSVFVMLRENGTLTDGIARTAYEPPAGHLRVVEYVSVAEHDELRAEVERLRAILDRPDPHDFVVATEIEARFQLDKWGDGDGQPIAFDSAADAYFFRLICHLASKALLTTPEEGLEKRLHRITTVAAAACNWHMREAAREALGEET